MAENKRTGRPARLAGRAHLSVYVDRELKDWLTAEVKRTGAPESAIVRAALEAERQRRNE